MLLQPHLFNFKEFGVRNVLPSSPISIEHISMELISTTIVIAEICNMYKYATTIVPRVACHWFRYHEVKAVCTSMLLQTYLLYRAGNVSITAINGAHIQAT